jgi:hypothetical protein
MMRHSKLEMTGRYTRPRAVDLEAAALMVPSLKPVEDKREATAATGTDGKAAQDMRASAGAGYESADNRNILFMEQVASIRMQNVNPLVEGSSPSPVNGLREA